MIEYPEYIELEGKKYKINTDYRVALRVLEVIDNPDISDLERSIATIVLLFGRDCPVNEESLELARKYLQCGIDDTVHSNRERDMDMNYDRRYIVSSFQKDYNIDIIVQDIHWWKFFYLLEGLGEDTALSRVRQIRNEDLSDYKDRKLRKKILEAKKAVALPKRYTHEEQESKKQFLKQLWGKGV